MKSARALPFTAALVVIWFVAVSITGQWGRVADNAAAALTMVFGSFVAGSTPQGGGAVAFPVFTKLLGVSANDAATFSLSIQAVGMGSATVVLALTRRAVDKGALLLTVPGAIAGYIAGAMIFSAVSPPAAYVKVFFTLVVVAAGASTVLCRRRADIEPRNSARLESPFVRRVVLAVAFAGGFVSALFGSGADVAVYLLLAIALGVRPAIGVATSVVTMAAVSIVGLGVSLATGALNFNAAAGTTDIFGMWLAAVPVVVFGAPIGSWAASRVPEQVLVAFIGALAGAELISTAIFLEDLRTQPLVALFAIAGLALTARAVHELLAARQRVANAHVSPQSLPPQSLPTQFEGEPQWSYEPTSPLHP